MRILLVRHGRSEANEDKSVLRKRPDHDIGLSDIGKEQAQICAGILSDWFFQNLPHEQPRIRVWHSPYLRAVQTADVVYSTLQSRLSAYGQIDRREHILLCEQQFGLFDGLHDGHNHTDNEILAKYPEEWAHYQKCVDFEGKFWARAPLGESVFDVAQRVHQSFGTFIRDEQRHGIDNLVIVCHGVVVRAFVMMWLHLGVSWFEKEPNPRNCSIRLIDDGEDRYIFSGFDKPKR